MLRSALLAALLLPFPALSARADMAAPPPPLMRAAQADIVVIGKVVSIEEKTVTARRFPGDMDKGEYRIAVVKIESAVLGAKDLTHIRVGYLPAAPNPRRPPPVQLNKDDEVILFLQPHFEGNFHIAPYYYDGITKKDAKAFDTVVADVKRAGKLLSDPQAGLNSKEQKDRFETAALLIARYRTTRPYAGKVSEAAIDVKESKLILTALAEADWGNGQVRWDTLTPAAAFSSLNLRPNDGWTPPQDLGKFPEAAKKWLKDNAETYRVKKFVYEKAEK